MQLHNISAQTVSKKKRRLGQGHGSGRVKTSGRGTKGQKSRRSIPLGFEGGALPLKKRLPFQRGMGRNKSFKNKPLGLNIKYLNLLPANSDVTIESLVKHKLVDASQAHEFGVKILGDGVLEKKLTVILPATNGAKAKIEKAGGTILSETKKSEKAPKK